MKITSILSKQTTLFLIGLLTLSTLFLPLTTLRAATLTNGMNAAYVLGTSDFGLPMPAPLSASYGRDFTDIAIDESGQRAFVSSNRDDRILVYDYSEGITNGMNASHVLGQSSFTSTASGTAANLLQGPSSLAYDSNNDYLYVVDSENYRVLVYDVSSITNGENAINVLGQADFISAEATTTQNGMSSPTGVAISSDGNTLFVAEGAVGRILVYDVSSITNGENAINVLGATDFNSAVATTTQSDFLDVGDIDLDGNTLYVADSGSYRVITFDVSSIINGEDAVNVLGQTSFTSTVTGTTAGTMNWPYDVGVDTENSRLFVADSQSGRVLVFDVSSIINGEDAVNVLGQANFTTSTAGIVSISQSRMIAPIGLVYDNNSDYLFVADMMRVLVFDLSTTPTPSPSSSGWNYTHPPLCQATFTPNTITKGEPTTLSWNATWPTERENNYYVKVPGEGLYSENVSSIQLTPNHSTVINMALFNLWGANFCQAEVTVLDENGEELTSNQNSYLTAGVSNSPIVKAIPNFFRSIFAK
jgi:DNA-binding beta-propeller fold protein YncE